MINTNLVCPNCSKKGDSGLQLDHTKKHYNFFCRCGLELVVPLMQPSTEQNVLDETFKFEILEPVKEKIDNMSYDEKMARLKELCTPEEWAKILMGFGSEEE